MHFANIQMGNFIWGRVYGLGKIGRGKVYDSLQEYSPLHESKSNEAKIRDPDVFPFPGIWAI